MKRFFQEAGDSVRAFAQFLQRHKGLVLWTVFIAFLAHGALLLHSGDLYTDTETYATDIPGTLEVFAKVGRFGLVFSKRLFFTNAYMPFLSVLYMIAAMCVCCLVFDFCLDRWGFREKEGFAVFAVVFNGLFLSCPILAHQFYFTYQSFEIAMAFLFCVLAAFSAYQYGYEGKSPWWGGVSIFFMVWAFSTYQVLVPFYIALCAIAFMVYYLHGRDAPKGSYLAVCVKVILLFLAGLAVYVAVSQVISRTWFHLDAASHLTDSYSCWGKEPLSVCLANIRGDLRRVVNREMAAYSRFYLPLTAVFLASSLYGGLRQKKKGAVYFILAVLLTVASPFLMTVLLGNYQIVRAQMVYPLVLAVSAAFTASFLCRPKPGREMPPAGGKETSTAVGKRHAVAASLAWLTAAFMVLLTLNQLKTVNRYYAMAHTVAGQDADFARRIYAETEGYRVGEGETPLPMVFIGYKKPTLPTSALSPWDAMGISYFEIDHKNVQGSVRIARLMQCLGLETSEPGEELYARALELAEDMPDWPAAGSTAARDGMIIVRLSEPETEDGQ